MEPLADDGGRKAVVLVALAESMSVTQSALRSMNLNKVIRFRNSSTKPRRCVPI